MFKRLNLYLFLSLFIFTLTLPVAGMEKLIRNYLLEMRPEYKDARIEINLPPKSNLSFKETKTLSNPSYVIDLPFGRVPLGKVRIPVKVFSNHEFYKKIFLSADVRVYEKIVVSQKKIKRGSLIKASDVERKEVETTKLSSSFFRDLSAVIGKESRVTIARNAKLLSWMLKIPPTVKKGEKVLIKARVPGIKVMAKGLMLEDGYLGKKATVRNLTSKKEVVGIVKDHKIVEVGPY